MCICPGSECQQCHIQQLYQDTTLDVSVAKIDRMTADCYWLSGIKPSQKRKNLYPVFLLFSSKSLLKIQGLCDAMKESDTSPCRMFDPM